MKELEYVLDEMKNKGFNVKKSSKRRMSPSSNGTAIDKIRAIWITMHKQGFVRDGSEAALDAYVKRMTSKNNKNAGIEHVGWLNDEMAYTVLESLKRWHRRLMAEELIKQGLTELVGHRKSWHTAQAPYAYVAAAYEGQQL
jgi:phage gp16-like protein